MIHPPDTHAQPGKTPFAFASQRVVAERIKDLAWLLNVLVEVGPLNGGAFFVAGGTAFQMVYEHTWPGIFDADVIGIAFPDAVSFVDALMEVVNLLASEQGFKKVYVTQRAASFNFWGQEKMVQFTLRCGCVKTMKVCIASPFFFLGREHLTWVTVT